MSGPALHDLIKKCEVISSWRLGRYRNPAEATRHAENCWRPDFEWCKANGMDYLPVVFPGFSWHNKTPDDKTDAISRLRGEIPLVTVL